MRYSDERLAARGLPPLAYVWIPGAECLGIIKRGEDGYYATDIKTWGHESEAADEMNKRLGLTKAQAQAMHIGSMVGWHVPGAFPEAHKPGGWPENYKSR